jgi:hypothetical protein
MLPPVFIIANAFHYAPVILLSVYTFLHRSVNAQLHYMAVEMLFVPIFVNGFFRPSSIYPFVKVAPPNRRPSALALFVQLYLYSAFAHLRRK